LIPWFDDDCLRAKKSLRSFERVARCNGPLLNAGWPDAAAWCKQRWSYLNLLQKSGRNCRGTASGLTSNSHGLSGDRSTSCWVVDESRLWTSAHPFCIASSNWIFKLVSPEGVSRQVQLLPYRQCIQELIPT
jgi:hypothetical protein